MSAARVLATLFLLVVPIASGAAPVVHRGLTIVPHARLPQGLEGGFVDAEVDVRLDQMAVALDLFPTFLAISATFALVGGDEGAEGLKVGFPERLGDNPGQTVRDVIVFLDGIPSAETSVETRAGAGGEARWRVWTLDIKPHQRIEINVRFTEIFSEQTPVFYAAYVLRTGALWSGPVGKTQVHLKLHNVTPEAVESTGLAPTQGQPMRWVLDGTEPAEDVRLTIKLPKMALAEALEKAPNYISSQPVTPLQTWVDAVIRLQRVSAESGQTPDWISRYYDRLIEGLESDSALVKVETERLVAKLAADWKASGHTADSDDARWCSEGLFKHERKTMPWPPMLDLTGDVALTHNSDGLIRACVARIEHNRIRMRGMVAGFVALLCVLVLLGLKRRRRKSA